MKHHLFDLTESFTPGLWMAAGGLVACFIISFHVMSKIHKDTQEELSSLLFVVAILSQRGPPFEVNWTSGRIMTFSALVFGFMLCTYFNSEIIVKLLSPPFKTDYTLESLLQSDLKIGAENVSYYYAYFTRYPFLILREIYQHKMKSTDAFIPLSEGLKKVRTEPYCFGGDLRILFAEVEKNFTDSEKCALGVVDMIAPNVPRSVALQKDSPYDELLATGYLLFMERGITHRFDNLWSNPYPVCMSRDFMPVEIYDILFVYVVIFGGQMISAIICLIEIYTHKARNTSKSLIFPFQLFE